MKILFLNNFRGFQETFIPFKQVNFLVGENSTGKSSILSLLKLMTLPDFWGNDDFNVEDIELGFFNELVSNNTSDRKNFQLAFHNDEHDRLFKTIKLNYTNQAGSPRLNEIRILFENMNIIFNIGEKQVRYKIKHVEYQCDSLDNFKIWVNDNNFDHIKYTVVAKDQERYSEFNTKFSFIDIKFLLRRTFPKMNSGLARAAFLPVSTWVAPIRTKPKRIYETFKLVYSSEGIHTPHLIKSILSNQLKKIISKETFSETIEKFGKSSGLFDKIEIEYMGKDLSSPFSLNVFLNGFPIKLTNVGYGVGQVLPLLTEILVSNKFRWFAIQQPEVHLHPRAQAALGDFIFDAVKNKSQNFLIETHSDFIIDRFRTRIKTSKTKYSSQVLYFERTKKGNMVSEIEIEEDGQYAEQQPKSFRNFFINEEISLLSL